MASSPWARIVRTVVEEFGRSLFRGALGGASGSSTPTGGERTARGGRGTGRARSHVGPTPSGAAYPGDYTGRVSTSYSPTPDGHPDPGEIVWAWVPYEEDHGRGKDRPALVVGTDGPWLLALQVTSKDHDQDAAQEARAGRYWMDIGTGPWDRQGRPSEVRLNRILRLDPASVRREGAALPRPVFDEVVAAIR